MNTSAHSISWYQSSLLAQKGALSLGNCNSFLSQKLYMHYDQYNDNYSLTWNKTYVNKYVFKIRQKNWKTSSYLFSDSTVASVVSFKFCSRTSNRSSSMFLRCSRALRDLQIPSHHVTIIFHMPVQKCIITYTDNQAIILLNRLQHFFGISNTILAWLCSCTYQPFINLQLVRRRIAHINVEIRR